MHGLLLRKFQNFARSVARELTWTELAGQAGVSEGAFSSEDSYPEEIFFALVATLAHHRGSSGEEIVELFGMHIATDLVQASLAWNISPAHWRTLDYVGHVQHLIHPTIARLLPGVTPPRLISLRYTPRKALIIYLSKRHLSPMAKGIILGMARLFRENVIVTIREKPCLITGAKESWIYVVRED